MMHYLKKFWTDPILFKNEHNQLDLSIEQLTMDLSYLIQLLIKNACCENDNNTFNFFKHIIIRLLFI